MPRLDALFENERFLARFRIVDDEGPRNIATCTPLSALQVALQLALAEHPADVVAALIDRETRAMLASLARPRRSAGEVVVLTSSAGFGGDPGTYRIDPDSEVMGCPLCGNPACQEWPTLARLDAAGQATGQWAYHVSECEMDSPALPGSAQS